MFLSKKEKSFVYIGRNMGYKEKILESLDGNKLTVKELAEKLGLIQKYIQKDNKNSIKPNIKKEARKKAESDIRVYINRIQKNKLKVVGKENKYKIYTLNKKPRDKSILKKMIPKFKEYGIKVDLEVNEINRIKELWEEINHT